MAVALASGVVGAGIGSALGHGGSTASRSAANAPSSGGVFGGFGFGGAGSGGEGSAGSAGSAGGGASTGTVDANAVAGRVTASVVDISTVLAGGAGRAAGTGMVLTPSGQILTNNHVIAGASTITVQIEGVGRSYSAHALGYDVADDVALLQVDDAPKLTPIRVGDASKLHTGDPVVAIGNAGGQAGPPSVSSGTVGALDQTISASDETGTTETLNGVIEMDAPIQPGDSGGPLANAAGEVVGMNTAAQGRFRRFAASNVGFAIPINHAVSIAHQIAAGHESGSIHVGPRALLGVEAEDLQAAQSPTGGGFRGSVAPASSGALVAGAQAGGPAARAGIRAGDVIVSADGKTIATADDLGHALATHHPGDRVGVAWIDTAGARHSATVALVAGPPA